MNFQQIKAVKAAVDVSQEITQKLANQEYPLALELVENFLHSEELKLLENDAIAGTEFLYLKGVALDELGKTEDAIEILAQLNNKHPGWDNLERSMAIVLRKLEKTAIDLMAQAPDSKKAQAIYELVNTYGIASLQFRKAIMLRDVNQGNKESAWEMAKAMLELSPNDDDYLQVAMEVAEAAGMHQERQKLLNHVRSMLEERPYRYELLKVLKEGDYEETREPMAA